MPCACKSEGMFVGRAANKPEAAPSPHSYFVVTDALPPPQLNSAPKLAHKLLFLIHKSRTVQAGHNSEQGDLADPVAPLMETRTQGGAPGWRVT